MKRSFFALLLALGAAFAVAPAGAQTAAPPSEPALQDILSKEMSPETKELATKLVALSGTGRLFDQILPDIADQAKNNFIRANPQMQLGIISIVDKIAVELVNRRPELDLYLARVWASAFTDDEMKDLITFFETDTGKKFSHSLPQVLAVQTAAAQQWGQSVNEELQEKVKAELQSAMSAEQNAMQSDTAGPADSTPKQ